MRLRQKTGETDWENGKLQQKLRQPGLRPETQQSHDWIEAQWGKAAGGIAAINSRWMSHLNGPLNAAQITVSCALGYIDLRHDARNWRIGNDALAKWQAEFETRPSMQATKP